MTAPLWFKAPFKILRLFVREKLRERVFTVSVPQLSLHVPREHLPTHLGGSLQINHSTWLLHCYKSMTNREDELLANIVGQQQAHHHNHHPTSVECSVGSAVDNNSSGGGGDGDGEGDRGNQTNNDNNATTTIDLVGDIKKNNGLIDGHSTGTATTTTTTTAAANPTTATTPNQCIDLQNIDNGSNSESNNGGVAMVVGNGGANANGQLSEMWSENPPSSASSGFSDDDSLAYSEGDPKTIEQIVQLVREKGRDGLAKEYAEIRARAPDGTFAHARLRNNLAKNRYTDVLCYDHSRVILSQENDEPTSDYINANFVDGYKQKNAYISTQGKCAPPSNSNLSIG